MGLIRVSIYKYSVTNLNLRAGQSMSSTVLAVIPPLTKLQVIDADDEWLNVIYQGQQGYVYKDYVSVSKYTTSNVNLRERDSITSNSLAIIPKKMKVEVIGNNDDWSNVIYDDKIGYVYHVFLSDDGTKMESDKIDDFYRDMVRYVNENQVNSSTSYLLTTDLKHKQTYIFTKKGDSWEKLYQWSCTIGKPSTPTITGTFYIEGRKPYFGTDKYRVKYATRIKDGYYYHSVLYDANGDYVIDGRLGEALSHGCIRLQTDNAQWIYRNIPDQTTVIIH